MGDHDGLESVITIGWNAHAVIGLLVASSAAFVGSHPRALAACAANCD
jgi:hypothetical protein